MTQLWKENNTYCARKNLQATAQNYKKNQQIKKAKKM